jgi:low affinity Fe/Cu permease
MSHTTGDRDKYEEIENREALHTSHAAAIVVLSAGVVVCVVCGILGWVML